MEKRVWRKECELCILYNNLSGANTHRCGRIREDRGRKRMEERTKKRTGGGRGARCEVRGARYAGTVWVWVFGL